MTVNCLNTFKRAKTFIFEKKNKTKQNKTKPTHNKKKKTNKQKANKLLS